MKTSKIVYSILLSIVLLTFYSCKDDESPKLQFVTDEGTFTLKNTNLYLSRSNSYENTNGVVDYRDYFITDGTFAGGGANPWTLSNYTNATYYIAFELAVPTGTTFTGGQFPMIWDWSEAPNSRFSYFYMEFDGGDEYFETRNNGSNPSISATGGFNGGETLTLKFDGEITYAVKVGDTWESSVVSGKLFYKGKIEDKRLL
jgi:hypothetical protein